jgi:hypothetical protein
VKKLEHVDAELHQEHVSGKARDIIIDKISVQLNGRKRLKS